MKLSLSWKVNIIIVIGVAWVLLAAGGYEISKTWQQLVNDLENSSTSILNRLAITLVNPMWTFNDDDILTFMQGEMQNENVLAIEVKRPVGQSNRFLLQRDESWQVISTTDTGEVITSFIAKESQIVRDEEILGTVIVYMTDRFINEAYQSQVNILLVRTFILLIIISSILFIFIERVIVRPVKKLTHQAQVIAGGNLDEVIVAQRDDELGILADSFEVMRQSIKDKINALHNEILERQRAENEVRELNEALEERVLARTQRLAVSALLSEQFNALLNFNQLLVVLVDKIKTNFNYYHVHIYLLDSNLQHLVMAEGTGEAGRVMKERGHVIPLNAPTSLVAQAARQGQVISVTNVREVENWLANPLLPDTCAEMAVPIIREGQVVGVLDVQSDKVGGLDEGDANLLRSLAGQVAVAMTNARLFAQMEQAQKEAEQARARADLANQAKSDFLSRMSHELRTPLNGILGYAQILKNDTSLSHRHLEGLSVIQQSGEHLLTLITDILDLAKIEAGKFELLPTPIALDSFMKNTIAIIQMRATQKRLELSYQPLSFLPEAIVVDEKRLRQVLLNLLNNAIKFTEAGQITLQLSILEQVSLTEVRLQFMVTDTGIGMTETQLQQIFNPFEQVSDMKKRAEGTGLGLAISKQLVEAMGGQLQVQSKFGHGSSFWFELDLPLANMSPTQPLSPHQHIIGYEGQPRKVLVVDDKLNNRMVFLNVLQPLGFEVAMAENGQEAIDQATTWHPDLILMDMIMPTVTGFEATQTIRQIPELKTIAIIGTSASAFEAETERVKLIGCDAFISKPVHVEELITLIGKLLNLQWVYQTVPLTSHPTETLETTTELIYPPDDLLNRWHELALEGDLLAIEEEAKTYSHDHSQYALFIEKLLTYTFSWDIDALIQFLTKH